MPFFMVRNDIVKMQADAIVNAANSALAPGGGVCGAIFDAAGYTRLAAECAKLGGCPAGEAVLTKGYQLPAKYIIHAVGPVWRGGRAGEAELLRSCYRRALELASKARCQSVAFPLISSGIYGYPKEEAMDIAVGAIRDYLKDHELTVYLVLFDRSAFRLGRGRMEALQSYIDDHYVDASPYLAGRREAERPFLSEAGNWPDEADFMLPDAAPGFSGAENLPNPAPEVQDTFRAPMSAPRPAPPDEPCASAPPASPVAARRAEPKSARRAAPRSGGFAAKGSLEEAVRHLDDSFSKYLFYLIDRRGLTDVEVYKRANLDRKLFSKLRREGYQPSKQTAIALCIALHLSLDESRDLLARAGYALSPSSKFDVIIEFFLRNGEYDIFRINEALFAFDQRLLGA